MKITISIQDDLHAKLKLFVSSRQISAFVCKSIKKELELREATLLKAYKEAYSDLDRNQEIDQWDVLNSDPAE
jgi:hypothetical protein